ncbi:MAG: four helix bundle protein [Prosthecobacter sp.]|uniref:four helix bundle protein n=1 Tax=Prosthecobacter sp. TaxID=1965333 RepID=UPI0025EA9ECE|nr:four helix bundle protein [Prosthecobacter sp.]MCF7788190.1 four helix bundle protein [Prosthecobacter sp.]
MNDLKQRTKNFALRVIKLVESLPKTRTSDVLGKQLIRSGTSVGANFRAACRGRSPAEFQAKMGIVEEEADECCYWIELLTESNQIKSSRTVELLKEAGEITAIAVASIKTSRQHSRSKTRKP